MESMIHGMGIDDHAENIWNDKKKTWKTNVDTSGQRNLDRSAGPFFRRRFTSITYAKFFQNRIFL